jgi:hypothetical protein
MRTIIFAFAVVAASTALNTGAAKAQSLPFCLLDGPGPGDCKYYTYGQCQAAALGTGYYCQPNFAMLPVGGVPVDPACACVPRGYRTYGYAARY